MANCVTSREDAACVAGRVLTAWRTGTSVDVEKQLELSRNFLLQPGLQDTWELEKREALQGALECLKGLPHARVSAAIRLLEHLAKQECAEVKC